MFSVLPAIHCAERDLELAGELFLSHMTALADFANEGGDIDRGEGGRFRHHLPRSGTDPVLYEIV
jgi:hypothetical protein